MKDMNIKLPEKLCGEPGEPVPPDLTSLVLALAKFGWWPIDFGENNGTMVELWLSYDPRISQRQAEHFLKEL